jgi:tetratricopeptide (TPR) repeat protein
MEPAFVFPSTFHVHNQVACAAGLCTHGLTDGQGNTEWPTGPGKELKMSRLLRKGAAMAVLAAGLLIYGVGTLLRAGPDASIPPARTIDDYVASARAALESGDTKEAYDTATAIITNVAPSSQTAEIAERVAGVLAATDQWKTATDLYIYAVQYGEGPSLKRALCGLATNEAKVGDVASCMGIVTRLSHEYAKDTSVSRSLNDVASSLARNQFRGQACDVYRIVAYGWAGSPEAIKATKQEAMTRIEMDDGKSAAACSLKLLSAYSHDSKAREYACLIGDEMCKEWMWDDANTVYTRMIADHVSNGDTVRATRGLAVVAIGQKRWDEATRLIDSIRSSDGALPVDYVCGEIARAYKDKARYAEAMPYYEAMVAKAGVSEVGFLIRGKMIKCMLLQGRTEDARISMDAVLAEFPVKMGIGKRIVLEAVNDCIDANKIDAAKQFVSACKGKGRDAQDEMWVRTSLLKCNIADGDYANASGQIGLVLSDFRIVGPELADAVVELAQALYMQGVHKQAYGDDAGSMKAYSTAISVSQIVINSFPQHRASIAAALIAAQSAEDTHDYAKALGFYGIVASAEPPHAESKFMQMHVIDCWEALGAKTSGRPEDANEGIKKACEWLRLHYPYDENVRQQVSRTVDAESTTVAKGEGL